jgi:hypothetical protein
MNYLAHDVSTEEESFQNVVVKVGGVSFNCLSLSDIFLSNLEHRFY